MNLLKRMIIASMKISKIISSLTMNTKAQNNIKNIVKVCFGIFWATKNLLGRGRWLFLFFVKNLHLIGSLHSEKSKQNW